MSAVDALDPTIHQPIRLRIMAALYRHRQIDFPTLRDGLGVTPGNLGAHLARLESAGYLSAKRVLAGLTFQMRYTITPEGSDAFQAYLAELKALLEDSDSAAPTARLARTIARSE